MKKYELITLIFTFNFLLSLSISAICIPIANKIGNIFSIIDLPNKRKHHKVALVRLGGIGILFGFLLGYFITYLSTKNFEFINSSNSITLVFISSILYFLIGLSDDFYQLNPFTKLFFQFLAASFLYIAGINFEGLYLYPFQDSAFLLTTPKILSYLITTFLIVGITNGFNWLDGLDGLAAGIAFILCISLGIIFINTGNFDFALIACSFAGSIVGFLRYNLYPAKILMGDCGSYLLGGTLISLSILGLRKNQINLEVDSLSFGDSNFLPIILLLFLFFVPVIDMIQVIILRLKDGYSPFFPDRRHLHHRLLSKGINERNTALILYTFTQISCCLALFFFDVEGRMVFICLSGIFFCFSVLYCFNMKSKIDPNYRKNNDSQI